MATASAFRARARRWLALAAATAAYVAAGKVGLALAVVNASASAVWLPTGIALATLLLAGVRAWPCVFIGAFVVNVTTAGNVFTSLGIAGGNAAEALVGAALIHRFAGGLGAFDAPRKVFGVVPLMLTAAAVSATIGVATLAIAGYLGSASAWTVWSTWWLGDAIGAVIACPPIVMWSVNGWPRWSLRQTAETAGAAVVVFAVACLVFENVGAPGAISDALVFICPLPIIWAALRLGRREAATASLLLMVVAVHGSQRGYGPFVRVPADESLLLLQTFIGITAIMGLAVAAVVDERNRLEAELAQRARDLARSNGELESFAYIAAHDLQEPVRMITTYAQLIQRRIEPQSDAKTNEYLAFVTASSTRMLAMVRSILDYSLLAKSTAPATEVDTGAAARQALQNLEQLVADADALVEVDALPRVTGDQPQLVRLFQNLVSNAIKFRSERRPEIRISARDEAGAWTFAVADNGIGIPAEGAGKLFGFFQRLHPGDRYPGTGIGLAACKRIVEQHGGRIWFESTPGAGTTFKFTIPR